MHAFGRNDVLEPGERRVETVVTVGPCAEYDESRSTSKRKIERQQPRLAGVGHQVIDS